MTTTTSFKRTTPSAFFGEGNRVKAVVQFRGREIAHVDIGKKRCCVSRRTLASTVWWRVSPRL